MGSISEDYTPPTPNPNMSEVETDFLIVGAGPAGASLACFLAQHNLKGILISNASGPARTPRAHIVNSAALECIRDLDATMYDECVKLGNAGAAISHYRWVETVLGEEYGRQKSWGAARSSEYEAVSPCVYMDFPQSLMEPVLLKWATDRGWVVRFDTGLMSFVDECAEGVGKKRERSIVASVVDQVSGLSYNIRTRYLFGADGGRSTVAKQLELPFTTIPGGGFAYNVLVRANLDRLMEHRQGNLHVVLRLDKDYPFICAARMVKPYHEWVFVFMPKGPDVPIPKMSHEEWAEVTKDHIGDASIDVQILDVSGWAINETCADMISKGNVFCLGDAIHRHPPMLGLGSNTCIQDAFNLAWKVALVHQGVATQSLLDTYNAERQPVGAHLVHESNNILRIDISLWMAMGLQPHGRTEDDRTKFKQSLVSNTKEGREKRKAMNAGIKGLHRELNALGTAYGQLYSSTAVLSSDEIEPFKPSAREAENVFENYDPCTYPGRRLPHVRLGSGSRIPGPLVSTLDIAGKGHFTLFTGIGGDKWRDAAHAVREKLGLSIKVAGVGLGMDYADVYLDWEEKRGVEEDGCVLVRPDYFVAWRAQESGNEVERLLEVMTGLLGHAGSKNATNGVVNGAK